MCFFQGRNTTAPLVFVVCPDQIKLIPDFVNISNEKKKAEDEEQTDVGVKDRNACGRSPWKHYEAESLSIVLVHVIILKAFSWQHLRLNIHHNNSPKTVPQLQKRNRWRPLTRSTQKLNEFASVLWLEFRALDLNPSQSSTNISI